MPLSNTNDRRGMHFDEITSDGFFDAMDSLLLFVNRRFDVVPHFDMQIESALDEAKAALVARTLWDNADIVDDYCAANPAHLSSLLVDQVSGWKNAISGFFTVVRYQDGCALLMNDAGVFKVSGITVDLDDIIGPAPAHVETTLIPYLGRVIYDGFLQAYDAEESELAAIQDEFELRIAREGIVSDAVRFAQVANAYRAGKLDEEMEAMLAQLGNAPAKESGEEELPQGFHRGILADEATRKAFEAKGVFEWAVPLEFAIDATALDLTGRFAFSQHDALALRVAATAAILYGVKPLSQVYNQYASFDGEPISRGRFEEVLRLFAQIAESTAALWANEQDATTYVVHYSLTEHFVVQQFMDGQFRDVRQELAHKEGGVTEPFVAEAGASATQKGTMEQRLSLDEQLQNLEMVRESLTFQHAEMPEKPLDAGMLADGGPLAFVYADPCVKALVAFLDGHVPDSQDDLFFARGVTEEVIRASIEISDLNAIFDYLVDFGLDKCSADVELLPRLVTNVFNCVPSWENNGWSARELMERLTGRKVFYAKDGHVLKVGSNEPCPCGSGHRFKECCGR